MIIDFIDYQFLLIIDANQLTLIVINCFSFMMLFFSVKISKNTVSLCILMMKTVIKLYLFMMNIIFSDHKRRSMVNISELCEIGF